MGLFSVFLGLVVSQQVLQPPMHRAWTEISDDSTKVLAVQNGILIYSSENKIRAIKISNGEKVWSKEFKGQTPTRGVINATTIFYDLYEYKKPSRVFSIDRKTGISKEIGLPFKGEDSRGLACDDKRLYLLEGSVVRAVDIATRKPLWKTDLKKDAKGRIGSLSCMTAGYGALLVGIEGLGMHSINPANGKVYWKENAQYGIYDPPLILPKGVVTRYKGLRLQNVITSKPIWTSSVTSFEPSSMSGDVLIGAKEGQYCGIDLKNGKVVWQGQKPAESWSGGDGFESLLLGSSGGVFAREVTMSRTNEKVHRLDRKGKELWSSPIFYDGVPIYEDSSIMICNDHERLLGYVAGAGPSVPTEEGDQRKLAASLVERYEFLDATEREMLSKVGKYASKALIEKYSNWAFENREGGPADREGRGQRLYGLLQETPQILMEICGPEDTTSLLAAIEKVGEKNSYQGILTTILGKKGDPNRTISLFVDRLKASGGASSESGNLGRALEAVSESSHPTAVKFMIEALLDPKAPPEWRRAAYIHLPGTGGEAGIEAVLKVRQKPGPRPTWQQTLMANLNSKNILNELKDSKGRTWRLIGSGVLGNYSDLFIQQKQASGWDSPVFVNVVTQDSRMVRRKKDADTPLSYKGININKLVESEWVKVFPDDPNLWKDSDKDGLTDLVEARLGTNPNKADTDGDGLNDSVDPCPNAAPRALDDREKIIAAAVEAYFFNYSAMPPPALISVDKIKPFELLGYKAPLIWSGVEPGNGLNAIYGAGVNVIGFSPPFDNFDENVSKKNIIEFSADGKSAQTTISRYSGGLNGEGLNVKLKKIGDEWFVIDIQMRYVS